MPTSEVIVMPPGEKPLSSRERILLAAKHLFARNGYENTSTVAIARDAGTSESQLMKHYGSKQGLLAAILDRGWSAIIARVQASRGDMPLVGRLRTMLEAIIIEMENDNELKELMTLEARRVRKDSREVLVSRGYQEFADTLDSLLAEMRATEQLRPGIDIQATRSALMGMVESLLRDQVVATRSELRASYRFEDVRVLLEVVVPALIPQAAQMRHRTAP